MTRLNLTACRAAGATAQRRVMDSPWHRIANASLLDVRAKVGVASSPLVTGSQAITGIGFQPKAVLPFGGPSTSAGTAINGAIIGIGAGVSSSVRGLVASASDSGVPTSNTARRHDNTKIFTSLSSTGSVLEACDLSAIGADGFTLNWTTIDANARFFNHICLGGADIEVSLTLCQMNNTNSAQSFAHGLSGAPTALFIFAAHSDVAPPITQTTSALSIGAWANESQWCANFWSNHGLTTTETRRSLTNDSVCRFNSGASHTIIRAAKVDSVDSVNVNVSYPVTASSAQAYFYMVAIRGAKCRAGFFDCVGSLSPLTIPCTGVTPKLFLPVFIPLGVQNISTVMTDVYFSIGASDGTNNASSGITDQNGLTTTQTRRQQSSTTLSEYGVGGSELFRATASFVGQSVVVSPSVITSSSFGQGAYLIIGA